MSITSIFAKRKLSDFQKEVFTKLDEVKDRLLQQEKTHIAESIMMEPITESSDFIIIRNNTASVTTLDDAQIMGKFNSREEAASTIQRLEKQVNRFYGSGYYYHVLSNREFSELGDRDDKEEKQTAPTAADVDPSAFDGGDVGGGDSMGESKDFLADVAKISSTKSGVITFVDGEEAPLTKASAAQILKVVNSKSPGEKAKLSSQLSKNYDSFLKTLNTVIKE